MVETELFKIEQRRLQYKLEARKLRHDVRVRELEIKQQSRRIIHQQETRTQDTLFRIKQETLLIHANTRTSKKSFCKRFMSLFKPTTFPHSTGSSAARFAHNIDSAVPVLSHQCEGTSGKDNSLSQPDVLNAPTSISQACGDERHCTPAGPVEYDRRSLNNNRSDFGTAGVATGPLETPAFQRAQRRDSRILPIASRHTHTNPPSAALYPEKCLEEIRTKHGPSPHIISETFDENQDQSLNPVQPAAPPLTSDKRKSTGNHVVDALLDPVAFAAEGLEEMPDSPVTPTRFKYTILEVASAQRKKIVQSLFDLLQREYKALERKQIRSNDPLMPDDYQDILTCSADRAMTIFEKDQAETAGCY